MDRRVLPKQTALLSLCVGRDALAIADQLLALYVGPTSCGPGARFFLSLASGARPLVRGRILHCSSGIIDGWMTPSALSLFISLLYFLLTEQLSFYFILLILI